ncbi:MAG: aminopeptidase [Candidatus Odinarchaeota archaeon]|nr:aminopeptidase [Candidatus Odinarchaeota archaeon]
MNVVDSAKNALLAVLEAEPGEKILIIADQEKEEVANAFSNAALEIGLWARRIILEKPKEYRKEVPVYLKEIVLSSNVDIFMNLLRGVAEEVSFRIQLIKLETRRKLRLAHCPGVTIDMLKDGALSLTIDEYRKMQDLAQRLLLALSDVEKVIVRNPHGTDVEFSVKGRTFFTDVKFDWKTMKWINIPVGEVIVAPVENGMNGVIVADLAAGGIGKLKSPIKFIVEEGSIRSIECEDREVKNRVTNLLLNTDSMSKTIGEFAIGLNKKARITDEFLEAEKVDKTVHFAFGNNEDFPGGKNTSRIHIDFLLSKPDVTIIYEDGREKDIMRNGQLLL